MENCGDGQMEIPTERGFQRETMNGPLCGNGGRQRVKFFNSSTR